MWITTLVGLPTLTSCSRHSGTRLPGSNSRHPLRGDDADTTPAGPGGDGAYRYSGIVTVPGPWSQAVVDLQERLRHELAVDVNSCLANLYRDGTDSMATTVTMSQSSAGAPPSPRSVWGIVDGSCCGIGRPANVAATT